MTWAPLVLSLEIATIAMVVSLLVGMALALLLGWRKLPARVCDVFDALISAPLVLPPTVLGYYLLVSLGPNSVVGRAYHWLTGTQIVFSFTAAVIAATVGSLPLVVRSIRLGLESVEPNVIAAARTLGANPLRVLATVTLPLAAPGIVAGAMLGFARALGDYGMTQMIAGTRIAGIGLDTTSPTSIWVYDQLLNAFGKEGPAHEAAARTMSLVVTVVGVAILFYANRLTRRLHPHRV